MRRLGFAALSVALLAGTSAFAQEVPPPSVGAVTGTAGSVVILSPGTVGGISDVGGLGIIHNFPAGPGTDSSSSSTSSFNSFVNIGAQQITFESSNQGAGPYIGTGSFSEVRIDVNNPTGQAVNFGSTITPAGLGFYLTNS